MTNCLSSCSNQKCASGPWTAKPIAELRAVRAQSSCAAVLSWVCRRQLQQLRKADLCRVAPVQCLSRKVAEAVRHTADDSLQAGLN